MNETIRMTNFSYLNSDHIISNMDKLIKVYKSESAHHNNRKSLFFEVINSIQNSNIPFEKDNVIIDFYNEDLLNHLITDGMMDTNDTIDNNHIFSNEDQTIIKNNINKAFQLIEILQPELHTLMQQLIGTIVCFRKKGFGGGSVSSLIGTIWLNPMAKWNVVDYAEALYHEFIHNSLFLDDMINSIFPDTKIITTDEALVTSTILKRKRPLDRSFHSAAVAIGLMHYYHLLSDYNKIVTFIEPLQKTIQEMNDKQKYLGEQGKNILSEMNNFIKNLDFESITNTLKFKTYKLS